MIGLNKFFSRIPKISVRHLSLALIGSSSIMWMAKRNKDKVHQKMLPKHYREIKKLEKRNLIKILSDPNKEAFIIIWRSDTDKKQEHDDLEARVVQTCTTVNKYITSRHNSKSKDSIYLLIMTEKDYKIAIRKAEDLMDKKFEELKELDLQDNTLQLLYRPDGYNHFFTLGKGQIKGKRPFGAELKNMRALAKKLTQLREPVTIIDYKDDLTRFLTARVACNNCPLIFYSKSISESNDDELENLRQYSMRGRKDQYVPVNLEIAMIGAKLSESLGLKPGSFYVMKNDFNDVYNFLHIDCLELGDLYSPAVEAADQFKRVLYSFWSKSILEVPRLRPVDLLRKKGVQIMDEMLLPRIPLLTTPTKEQIGYIYMNSGPEFSSPQFSAIKLPRDSSFSSYLPCQLSSSPPLLFFTSSDFEGYLPARSPVKSPLVENFSSSSLGSLLSLSGLGRRLLVPFIPSSSPPLSFYKLSSPSDSFNALVGFEGFWVCLCADKIYCFEGKSQQGSWQEVWGNEGLNCLEKWRC